MGIKKDPATGLWDVTYSKRPKGGGSPLSLRRKRLKSEAEAKKVERELIIEVERKLLEKSGETWKDVLKEFLDYNKGSNWTFKTHQNYESTLKAYTLQKWGKIAVKNITTGMIRDLITKDLKDVSESTRKSMWKYLNGTFNFALEKGYLLSNPVPKMKFRLGEKIEAVLNEDQIKLFLDRAEESGIEWYPVWKVGIFTGMRNGELYALKWSSVDLVNRKIIVREAWDNKAGFKPYPKNRHHRILEIPNPLLPLLKELKESRENEFVLPRIDKWDRGEQARELQIFLVAMGLPKMRFHDLRGTYCTLLLNRGVEPAKVMMMAGWSDLKTMARYLRKAGILLKGSTDVLDDVLDSEE